MKIEYRVITSHDIYSFEATVSDMIESGYKTVGGVSISENEHRQRVYAQAIVKRIDAHISNPFKYLFW